MKKKPDVGSVAKEALGALEKCATIQETILLLSRYINDNETRFVTDRLPKNKSFLSYPEVVVRVCSGKKHKGFFVGGASQGLAILPFKDVVPQGANTTAKRNVCKSERTIIPLVSIESISCKFPNFFT